MFLKDIDRCNSEPDTIGIHEIHKLSKTLKTFCLRTSYSSVTLTMHLKVSAGHKCTVLKGFHCAPWPFQSLNTQWLHWTTRGEISSHSLSTTPVFPGNGRVACRGIREKHRWKCFKAVKCCDCNVCSCVMRHGWRKSDNSERWRYQVRCAV